jgi:hypothetical protein
MSKSLANNFKSGFLLLEIVITVAVLSLGLVFLSRSFISSLDAAKTSSDYTLSISLLENKLWELEMSERIATFFISEPPSQSGDFGADYEGFSWAYLASPLEANPSLEELNLEVSWVRARRKGKVNLTTYMYAKEE